jgi:hypothetical protein
MNAARTHRRLLLSIILAALAVGSLPHASASTDFSDGDFSSGWTYGQITAGNGGSASISLQGSGGSPGAHLVAATSVAADCGAIYAFGLKSSATYNPATDGALASFNYSEDAKLIDGFGSGQATGPAIWQAGKLFVLPGFPTGTDGNWHHMARGGLTASEFIEVLGGPCPNYTDPGSHPDFSENGSTMTFGFFRANSQIDGFGSYSITAAIDNWFVSLGPNTYAALGDSYSSGEGVSPFFPDSNTLIDHCHRSTQAYGFKVAFKGVELHEEEFLACSGALTSNILPGGKSPGLGPFELPQLAKRYPPPNDGTTVVNDDTDMVSLTVGGDDLGFVWILENCGKANNDCSSDAYHPLSGSNKSLKQILNEALPIVAGRVAGVYGAIQGQTQDPSIFVLGYPRLFGAGNCPPIVNSRFTASERQYLDSLGDALNQRIAASAAAMGVHFVSVADTFAGHGICSSARWIKDPNPLVSPRYSWFHPTARGQLAYAQALTGYMND